MNFAFLADAQGCQIGWGAVQRSEKASENAFYINDFYLESTPWHKFEHFKQSSDVGAVWELFSQLEVGRDWECAGPEKFTQNFAQFRATDEFRLRKILLSICDRAATRLRPRALPPLEGIYFYGFHFDDAEWSAWGTSPELLFHYDAKKAEIQTVALAGTLSREQLKEKSGDDRLELEHDLVANFFQDLALGHALSFEQKPRELSPFALMSHLRTPVSMGNIKNFDPNYWLGQFHPTPALGVAPRSPENLQLLRSQRADLPPHFGAPFGVFEKSRARFIVMIRGQFAGRGNVYRPIGVGVTRRSTVDLEWEEINLKRRALEELWSPVSG